MSQKMYKVAEGKHQMPDGTIVRAIDPAFPLDDEEVAKFPGKFVLQMTPVTEEAATAEAEAAAAAKAAADAAAKKAAVPDAPAK